MSKIKVYENDVSIEEDDKVIGTDGTTGADHGKTKNFTISALTSYIRSQIINPSASDFKIPVFNQEGLSITDSIIYQDSSPSNGVAGTEITIEGNLTLSRDQSDTTLTLISDTSNIAPGGEKYNPSIHFIQDGGAQNAAIGFNIIDDTDEGVLPGTGNRFWIVNAMADDLGSGGITFGTINQDGWENAVARFMIRGDGKGLFGHPNENYGGSFDSMFEVYDDRTENSTTDMSFVVQGVVDITEPYTPVGAGGIEARLKATNSGTITEHGIAIVPGIITSDIMTSEPLVFYANSDMDTSSATGFSGNIGTNGNWNFGTSFVATPASTVTVSGDAEVIGSANGVILESPNGTRYRITVDDSGNLSTTAV